MQLLALVKKSALIALLPFLFPLEQYSTLVIAEISWIPLLAASPEWWMVHRTGVLHNSSIELITEDHKRSINYKTTFFFAVCLKQTQIALWRTIGYRTSLAPINFTDLQGIYLALLDGIFIALFFFQLTCTIPYEGIKEETFSCHLYFELHSDQYVCFWHRVSILHLQLKCRLSGKTWLNGRVTVYSKDLVYVN